jgi:hypothetical protein
MDTASTNYKSRQTSTPKFLAENEKIIEDNQALQLHQSRMEKYITLCVKSKKWPYSSNYLPLQPLETSRTRISKGGDI